MRPYLNVMALLLYMLLSPNTAPAQSPADSLVMNRLFNYSRNFIYNASGVSTNVYIKHFYQTHRRNFTLWCIPSMYAIANGKRSFVSENYSRLSFKEDGSYNEHRQVYCTTIPHNRSTMPTLLEFAAPQLYNETLYGDHILSPFHRTNRVFYKYFSLGIDEQKAHLYFRPRYVKNTQLVSGRATIDLATGRIIEAEMDGEFDMIHFKTTSSQGDYGSRSLLPKFCSTKVDFKFMGNNISSAIEASFDCPITLPDSVTTVRGNMHLMDSVRPYNLTSEEQALYRIRYANSGNDSIQQADTIKDVVKESKRKRNYWKWDRVGESLVRRMRYNTNNAYVHLSPLINPQYISYSRRKGFSYRFKLGAKLNISDNMSLGLNTRFGYNFKQRKFYFNLPLHLDYSYRGRDAYAEIAWASGNRIYNSTVVDEIRRRNNDAIIPDEWHLDQFDDWNMHFTNNLPLNNRLAIETGLVFHQRKAANSDKMKQMGLPHQYLSMAPMISIKARPWRKGPLFTVDYERGLPGKKDFLTYERWELDASLKHRMPRLQTLNLRLGTGFYTKRDKNYFMDYSNFRDENLPEGWDDDWAGNFQLLNSHIYNESNYYVRGNASFESPMMAGAFIPLLGRYVERERVYLSTMSVANTRLYSELGYGFTCRVFSVGIFASFLSTQFKEFGAKFTFELFRRW